MNGNKLAAKIELNFRWLHQTEYPSQLGPVLLGGYTRELLERVVKMGKNKNKKQTESQATKGEKAYGVSEEIKEGKSDIDKILDDWLNGCDDDEIPDENELIVKAKQKEENVVKSEPVTTETATSESKSASGYKALPMEDANDAWMDDDVGFTMEEEEDEDLVVVTKKETQNLKGLKPKVISNDNNKSKEQPIVAVINKGTSPKKSDGIDNILDDWLNGADEDIPDELPDIDVKEVKKEAKKNVKAAKTQKKNAILNDMSKLSNIMDDCTDKNVQSSVEGFFGGSNKKPGSCEKSKPKPPQLKSEKKSDDIDSILDDWMNGGEEEENIQQKTKKFEKKEEPKKEEKKKETEKKVPEGDCTLCGKLARMLCSGCKNVFYCDRDCQKKHWSSHKNDCKKLKELPFRIERSSAMGRFLMATRNISEGELIFTESPMICGPKQLTKPVCLGCHKELTSTTPYVKCIRCNWPVCSQKCGDCPQHDPECRATRAAGARIKVEHFDQINMMYACITVLRALSLKDGSSKIWDEYTKFDSHLQERMKTPIYNKVNKEKVCFFILHYLNIKRYSDLEILEACGKLDTNCFEIKQHGLNLRALYRLGSIMSHHCCPNTKHTFDRDNNIFVYSTRKIAAGEVISATYTKSLYSTMERLDHLNVSKCFMCECERCGDPTEFGSFLSSIKCSMCPGHLMPIDPLNVDSNWKCDKCDNEQRASGIRAGNTQIVEEMKSLDRHNLTSLAKFLSKYEALLGSSNHHIVEIKFAIMMMLGNNDGYPLGSLTKELLEMKENFATQLLDIANKIEPGLTKIRGQILLELQIAQVLKSYIDPNSLMMISFPALGVAGRRT